MKKKIVLGTITLVMALAMMLPVSGVATAQTELAADVAPVVNQALAIRAPGIASVGQLVTIQVVEKHTGRPVPRAAVFAVNVKDIVNETDNAETYASLAERHGRFLGWTDMRGNVSHRFRESGEYILVAAKAGFTPGFTRIAIRLLKALAIRAPETAWIGRLVTMQVVEKHVHKPVPGAAVFAVNVKDIVSETDGAEAYAEIARDRGYFIGLTNRNGEVVHRFREAGRYVLVTFKDGFVPGFTRIGIKPLQPVSIEPIAVPE